MLLRRTDPCMTGDLPLSHGILTAIARLVNNDKNSVGRQSRQHSESVQATHKFIRDADGEDKAEPLQHRLWAQEFPKASFRESAAELRLLTGSTYESAQMKCDTVQDTLQAS